MTRETPIQLRRGARAAIILLDDALDGEPFIAEDTHEAFFGQASGAVVPLKVRWGNLIDVPDLTVSWGGILGLIGDQADLINLLSGYQPWSNLLTVLSTAGTLPGETDSIAVFSVGAEGGSLLIPLTPFARTILDDVDAAAARATIGAGTGSGDALTTNPLSQFTATTSAQLAAVLTDETGTGAAVFADTPSLVTPDIGAATGTSLKCTGYNTTDSTARFGSWELQPYALNNTFFSDNLYYSATGFRYRQNGYGTVIQSFNGDIIFYAAPSGLAGPATVPNTGRIYRQSPWNGNPGAGLAIEGTAAGVATRPATSDSCLMGMNLGGSVGLWLGASGFVGWGTNGGTGAGFDLLLSRVAAANLRQGYAPANPPLPQTSSVQNASGDNIQGVSRTYSGSLGTGNAAVTQKVHVFNGPVAVGSGSTAQTEAELFSVTGDGIFALSGTAEATSPTAAAAKTAGGLAVAKKIITGGQIRPGAFTVATLPAGANGDMAYATDGRKVLELPGAGTGTHVLYSNGQWRLPEDQSVVAA